MIFASGVIVRGTLPRTRSWMCTGACAKGVLLVLRPGRMLSYVEIFYTADFCGKAATIEDPSLPFAQSSFRLFGDALRWY